MVTRKLNMKIRRLTQSQDASNPDEARIHPGELGIERDIYRKLSSRTDNRTLMVPEDNDSEWHRFLLTMNDINDGIAVSPEADMFDEYLGTLGLTDEYPFPDDKYISEQWIELGAQPPFRQVVDKRRTVVYTDPNTSITYNVIHNTGV